MENCSISKATLGRLPCYLNYLSEASQNKIEYVSATIISKALSLGEVQVRKDLNSVSGAGKPKIGYSVNDLIKSIENALGYGNIAKAVIVGAGKLGQALLNFDGFREYGVEISAAFDLVPKVKDEFHREVLPMGRFESFCKENNIKIGVITVCESAAQQICNLMVKNNIHAIWNFTPAKLNVPENVILKQENMALSLAYLNQMLIND